jgi:hypothetical protein
MTTLRILLLAGVAAVAAAGPANSANRARATADRPKMEGRSVGLPNHGRPTYLAEPSEAEPTLNPCFGQQPRDRFLDAALTMGTLGLWRIGCHPDSEAELVGRPNHGALGVP